MMNIRKVKTIDEPSPYDVLFGRGKPYQKHPGNLRLHAYINQYRARYSKARRDEKTAIADEIVQFIKTSVKEPGRFLKRVEGEVDGWVEVNDGVARQKVSHALRAKKAKTSSSSSRPDDLDNSAQGKREPTSPTQTGEVTSTSSLRGAGADITAPVASSLPLSHLGALSLSSLPSIPGLISSHHRPGAGYAQLLNAGALPGLSGSVLPGLPIGGLVGVPSAASLYLQGGSLMAADLGLARLRQHDAASLLQQESLLGQLGAGATTAGAAMPLGGLGLAPQNQQQELLMLLARQQQRERLQQQQQRQEEKQASPARQDTESSERASRQEAISRALGGST